MEPNSDILQEPVHCNVSEKQHYKTKIIWHKVILFTGLHFAALYGFLLMFTANWKTSLFAFTLERVAYLGISAGAHRLWCHHSYKARWPLRAILVILHSIQLQDNIYEWCKEHRIHHKFVGTNADPHNIKRGFFFAHIGWLMCTRHPDFIEKEKTTFLDDVLADPIIRFQRRFYIPMALFFAIYLPTMIPVWYWGETAWNSFYIAFLARYFVSLQLTWIGNSVAHTYGKRPFDKNIEATDIPFLMMITSGEAWHNYHHAFPWDYANNQQGFTLNPAKVFIDIMAMIGLAYDIKTAKLSLVRERMQKSGDGTRVKLDEKVKRT